MLNFYPGFIDNTNFKHINIDGKYVVTICIINYPKKMQLINFSDNFPRSIKFDMSIFIKKQDTMKVLKELTYSISSSKAEINTVNNNQIDIDVLDKITSDAKKLRYEIQINNEQIYQVYTYISISSDNKDDILYSIKKLRNALYSKMLISNLLNFRHLQGYLATLPINILRDNISKVSYVNMTTSNVVNMFPFYSDTIFDKYGVIFGYTSNNKRICNINIFNDKYTNSNICIFGSSGSGKSYFVKLLILRQYISDIKQIVFDPEGEYTNMSYEVGGEYVAFNNDSTKFINIMDINKVDMIHKDFLDKKISEVYDFLSSILNIEKENKNYMFKSIRRSYLDKGITENISSMYNLYNNEVIYVNKTIKNRAQMPILEDVYINMKSSVSNTNKSLKSLTCDFEDLLIKYNFLNNKTNVDLNNNLFVYSFNKLDAKMSSILFRFILNEIVKKIKYDKAKCIIYIDELWKFIYNDSFSAEQVFMLFKTIRKSNASIVSITQDMSDFFSKDLGAYGKSIINNSFIKIFFKMEYCDTEVLSKIGILTINELNEILRLSKGSMLMYFQSNIIKLDIKSNDYEDNLIKGEKFDSFSRRK